MKIAVTGATGQLGRHIVNRLRERIPSDDIVALARTPAKADDLAVLVRQADYGLAPTLEAALAGIDTLMMISGSEVGQRVPQHRNLIEAAIKAGVRRVVYTSLLHADRSTLSLAPEHVETEGMLARSGLSVTVLRNGWYTENYTASARDAVARGMLMGSAGQGRIASATRADYADAAVAVLLGQGHEGRVHELAGDSAYTLSDLAAEISRRSGREVQYRDLSPGDYTAALMAAGAPEPWPHVLPALDVEVGKGALYDDSRTLSRLIGRRTTSLADAVAAALE